jgi:hypothetical protein
VPLGDVGEYYAWIERESPSAAAQRVTRAFLLELDERPWAAPSIPVPEVSNQPEYEVRTVSLEVPGGSTVTVWWEHVYATGDVDILAVTLL